MRGKTAADEILSRTPPSIRGYLIAGIKSNLLRKKPLGQAAVSARVRVIHLQSTAQNISVFRKSSLYYFLHDNKSFALFARWKKKEYSDASSTKEQ